MGKNRTSIKVSVIIPVYNMAVWVGHAIESIEKQTLKELEIICIDDGPTDNTLAVLRAYQEKYANLVILHQKNAGAGPARNRGIERAKGEFLAFHDADDYYYSDDALEYLYLKAKENNAVICRGASCDDKNGILSFDGLRPERTFQMEGFISSSDFPGPTGFWASFYNRQFLIDNQICFPALRRGQDGVFSIMTIGIAGKVYCVNRVVYVYRKEHKDAVFTEEKALALMEANFNILLLSSQYGMTKALSAWKRELLSGEKTAILYKFAAEGSSKMQNLVSEYNTLLGGVLYEGDEIKAYVDQVKKEKPQFLDRLK